MSVLGFQSFFAPLLRIASDGSEHTIGEAREKLARELHLTADDISERLPSGTQTKFGNRVARTKTYFVQAGVLTSPRRGCLRITDRGRELLRQNHDRIDIKILSQYPEFVEFSAPNRKDDPASTSPNAADTPEERLQKAYQSICDDLAGDLLIRVRNNAPSFFETLVVDLIVAMGYGGSRADAAESIGQSGDEGIDGIIKEDRLGLDVTYLQAKRWEGTVGRPEIRKFVGALTGKRAKRGSSSRPDGSRRMHVATSLALNRKSSWLTEEPL